MFLMYILLMIKLLMFWILIIDVEGVLGDMLNKRLFILVFVFICMLILFVGFCFKNNICCI